MKRFDIGFCLCVFLLLLLFLMGPYLLVDPEGASRTLRRQGYKNIEVTGWRPFSGSEGDLYSTGFRAIAPDGWEVTGTVTSGLLKGYTVRLD